MHSPVAAFVFLFTIAAALVVSVSAIDAEYKNDCFYSNNADNCQSKIIDINSRVYGCDSVVDFDTEITKIQFQPGETNTPIIVVQDSNSKSYTIDEIEKIKKDADLGNLPSCTYVVDKQQNAYKIESGEVSVTGPKGIRTRPIKTEPDLTPVKLALDPITEKLVILSLRKNSIGDTKEGSLFALDIDYVNSVGSGDSELYAERISPFNVVITGVSIYEGLDDLIVGIKLGGKSKFVKLTAVPEGHKCYREGRKAKRTVVHSVPVLEVAQDSDGDNEERTVPFPKTTVRRIIRKASTITTEATTTTESPVVNYTFNSYLFGKLRVGANLLDNKLAPIIRPFAALLND